MINIIYESCNKSSKKKIVLFNEKRIYGYKNKT